MTEAPYECQDDCPLKDRDGNCYHRGDDGEVVQCVDDWAEEKYYYLERYLIASREARNKFSVNGNAVYADLFAGPGICRLKRRKVEIAGGRAESEDFAGSALQSLHRKRYFNR